MNKIVYIYSKDLRKLCDKLPKMRFRSTRVHELISCSYLLSSKLVSVISPDKATEEELKLFHSSNYIDFVKNHETGGEAFGLCYDCPILENLYEIMITIAGGTLTAAKFLLQSDVRICMNWFGGWHHAQKSQAEGFCYVNDIVIGITKLLEKFERVLYLDLDVHHGNGVETAFYHQKNVLTLSIHKQSPGFYPGSGLLTDVGDGNGKHYSINVPLKDGISDETYSTMFENIFPRVVRAFQPEAMVVQCGADILTGDSLGECNVTLETMGNCVKCILNCDVPLLFLGGGGYNFQNSARYWTYLTSIILNVPISEDIPDNSLFFTEYTPTYELFIAPRKIKDYNTKEYLQVILGTVYTYCDLIEADRNK